MRNKVTYEWAVEYVNSDGDIENVDHADKREKLVIRETSLRTDIALVRITGNDEEGEFGRGYAYVVDGKLESHFDSGDKVPARYMREAL